ncbi:ABC transporter permease [Faecalibacillus intestinalis]|uniref:ABC transporter permease n=1 Tax=Faecalibacillus intestinalis TaxID=1982626 RepID=UPI003991514A
MKSNVKKEIRGKYKGSFLGVLWSFINPLLQTIVYTIVFSIIMKNDMDNYLIFVVTGIIPWNFFLTTMVQGMTTIKANAGIIKKVYFPREILPISVVLSGLVNFFISCLIIIVFCIFGGVGISWHIVLVPLIAVIQFYLH